ncbi:hypothetical protein ANO14919_131680 [Xylariales sp. No.14919]|nr:hypothetical protein ANO14919_131680 [Xylariales sp. No.14919]
MPNKIPKCDGDDAPAEATSRTRYLDLSIPSRLLVPDLRRYAGCCHVVNAVILQPAPQRAITYVVTRRWSVLKQQIDFLYNYGGRVDPQLVRYLV